MSRKQVESILGPPTSVDSTNLLVTKKVTYIYQQGNESVTIVFFNDEVCVEGKQPSRLAVIRGGDDDDAAFRLNWNGKWTKRSAIIRPSRNGARRCR